MAAKKSPAKKVPSPKKPASAADFRKKEEEDKRIARETKRNPVDESGNSYFGGSDSGMKQYPKLPNPKAPAGTPWKERTKNPNRQQPTPSVTPPKPPKPPTTPIIPTMPRGMNILGILVPSDDKKKKKKK